MKEGMKIRPPDPQRKAWPQASGLSGSLDGENAEASAPTVLPHRGEAVDSMAATGARRRRKARSATVYAWQLVIVLIIIVGWQYVPKIPGISKVFSFEDPFFISSPSRIVVEIGHLIAGSKGSPPVWSAMGSTLLSTFLGTAAALLLGTAGALVVSNWGMLERIFRPFLVISNAVPRIAIIPIIVLIVGASVAADAVAAFVVVFFIVFYNAYAGAISIPAEMIQSSHLLGASKSRVMWKVRLPYALVWTMMALPNAIAFGLTTAVTAGIFSGGTGLGYQLVLAIDSDNATLLFSIVVLLAIIGVILVLGSTWLRRVLMPWWESSEGV